MVRYATLEDARDTLLLWQGDPASAEHLGDRGNSVYRFKNRRGEWQILRFTDPDFRTLDETRAELELHRHLEIKQAPTCYAVASSQGGFTHTIETARGPLIASSLTYVSGILVQEGDPHWNRDFFRAWGRNLGEIHRATRAHRPIGAKRWHWSDEILIRKADELLPKDDVISRKEFEEVMAACAALKKTEQNFGLIHADHAPQNFNFDPVTGKIVAFDFGNCCYHWYIADLAISLSTVRRKPNREEIRAAILKGYAEMKTLPEDASALIDLFIRLRVVYVYLSRLHLFGKAPNDEQLATLESLKKLVHAQTGWPA